MKNFSPKHKRVMRGHLQLPILFSPGAEVLRSCKKQTCHSYILAVYLLGERFAVQPLRYPWLDGGAPPLFYSLLGFPFFLEGQSKYIPVGTSGPESQGRGPLSSINPSGQTVSTSVCTRFHRLILFTPAVTLLGGFQRPLSFSVHCTFQLQSSMGLHVLPILRLPIPSWVPPQCLFMGHTALRVFFRAKVTNFLIPPLGC